MKSKCFWFGLTFLLVAAMLLASCTTKTTSSTSTTTATIVTSTTATTTGKWWDKLGAPQYGGTITLQVQQDINTWDPYQGETGTEVYTSWIEQLFTSDGTVDPATQNFQYSFVDASFVKGQLLQNWEYTDPSTLVMHVRQGIYWQNIPPANGREFNANDIVFHFNRICGIGSGYTTPAPVWKSMEVWIGQIASLTATDDYTVVMKWKISNTEYINEILLTPGAATSIENPEAVQQWGDVTDWHHAIGTGPFMLTNYISGTSATMDRNPNYWQFDDRYPQNKLPYADELVYLIVPDQATALSALRTGKLDILDNVTANDVQTMKKSNPEILLATVPGNTVNTIDPRDDIKPFSDIRVREALQQSINLTELANTYYQGTVSPDPSTMTSNFLTGWGWPYDQWPQTLKDEYAYNVANAKALLTAAGYPNGFSTDCIVSNDADVSLLQAVKGYFALINVDMTIKTMDPASFVSYVVNGGNNDALAMRGNGQLGFNYAPYFQVGHYAKGQVVNYMRIDDPVLNSASTDILSAPTTDGWKAILLKENQVVAENHYLISLLQTNAFSFYQPWIIGFNAQYGSTWGWGGPQLLFYWDARFWVDSKIKSSYGH